VNEHHISCLGFQITGLIVCFAVSGITEIPYLGGIDGNKTYEFFSATPDTSTNPFLKFF